MVGPTPTPHASAPRQRPTPVPNQEESASDAVRSAGLTFARSRAVQAERQRSVRAVFALLERERLAPCSAEEFIAAGRPATPLVARPPFCGLAGGMATPSAAARRLGAAGAACPAVPACGAASGTATVGGPAAGAPLESELLVRPQELEPQPLVEVPRA